MEYSFDVRKLFQETITIWDSEAIKKFTHVKSKGGNHTVVNHLADVFNSMGVASAKAYRFAFLINPLGSRIANCNYNFRKADIVGPQVVSIFE